jgi:hypothetical protein
MLQSRRVIYNVKFFFVLTKTGNGAATSLKKYIFDFIE